MSSASCRIEAEHVGAVGPAAAQRLAWLIATYSIEMTAKDGDALRDVPVPGTYLGLPCEPEGSAHLP